MLMQQLCELQDKTATEKAALMAELEEAREQGARERAYLTKENLDLESQQLSQRQEAAALWTSKNVEFVKSSEFDALCTYKSIEFFKLGFKG